MVISREYSSVFGAILALYLVNLGLAKLGPDTTIVSSHWHLILGISALFAAAIYLIKTRSRLLKVS